MTRGDALSLGLAICSIRNQKLAPWVATATDFAGSVCCRGFDIGLHTGQFLFCRMACLAAVGVRRDSPWPGRRFAGACGAGVNVIPATVLRKGRTVNERVVSWHLFEVCGRLGCCALWRLRDVDLGLGWLDSYLALGLSVFVSINVLRMLWTSVQLFLQMAPQEISVLSLEQDIRSIPGVVESHDFHLWSWTELVTSSLCT